MDKQVCIGTIVAPHGVRGDIRILPQTEHPEQFLELDYLLLEDGRTLRNRTTRHYRNGKLDGSYHVESTRDGKPYITIEGQYTTARNRDVGNSTMPPMTQPMNGMNDFLFSQVDFIKLPPKVRTFGKRCYICK